MSISVAELEMFFFSFFFFYGRTHAQYKKHQEAPGAPAAG